jgi:hypothetical protein
LMNTLANIVAPSAMANINQRRTVLIVSMDTRSSSHSRLRMLN